MSIDTALELTVLVLTGLHRCGPLLSACLEDVFLLDVTQVELLEQTEDSCSSISDLNLLDWSANNHLAVALGSSVYLWNASSGDITQLFQFDNHEEYIGAVAWVKEGNYLAVGSSTGDVQVSFFQQ